MNISWKMSLPAQPDWIFQVNVCPVATPPPTPAAGDELAPPLAAGAFCGRQAAMNAPIAESEKYLRNPRREELGSFTIRTSHFPPARGRANIRCSLFPRVKRGFSPVATCRHRYLRPRSGSGRFRRARKDARLGGRGGELASADPQKRDGAVSGDLAELPAGGRVEHPDRSVGRERVETVAVLAQ